MVKERTSRLALGMLLAALPVPGWSQDAGRLDAVIQAMGAENVSTIRYTARGSGYRMGEEDGAPEHYRILSFSQETDFNVPVSRVRIETPGDSAEAAGAEEDAEAPDAETAPPAVETRILRGDAAWDEQYELWLGPHAFVKAAMAAGPPAVEAGEVRGLEYDLMTVELNDRRLIGYLTEDGRVERVRTAIADPEGQEVQVEATYLHYEDFGGVQFPTTIIRKENDRVKLILIVEDVEPGAALDIPVSEVTNTP